MSKLNRRRFLTIATPLIPTIRFSKSQALAGGNLERATASSDGALQGTCTHQGCNVALEKAELVCPCHGSIFQASTGAVISGPNGAPKNQLELWQSSKWLKNLATSILSSLIKVRKPRHFLGYPLAN